MEMLNTLEPLLRTFWYVAIPTSLIFLLQTIMTFAGGHHGDGFDGSIDDGSGHDGAGFQVFTLRNLINFLLGFSWTGISLYSALANHFQLIGVAVLVGLGFVWMFFILIKQLQRLSEDNSFQLESAIGKEAEVYLKIPANRQGRGKVLVSVKGATHELEAMTDGPEIPSSSKAKVVGIDSETRCLILDS
ncbi:MAG: NfeD family protein [Saprospiraceae bacterium]|nr:NfeD family protein [Saprospiraceae bacterium]